jgi:drug/metabolite transporter (DMT)-like permease
VRNLAFLVLAAASWGTGTVVSKQAVAEIQPLTLLPIQLGVSVAFLLAFTRFRGISLPGGREGRLLGRLGLLNPGLAYALSLVGLVDISASLSVLLWATEPLFILALAAVVLGERVGIAILAPSAIAVVGLGLVVVDPAAGGSILGIALTVAGVVVCAVYTVATRKSLLGSDSTFGVVLAQQLHALGFAIGVVVALALGGRQMLPAQVSAGAAVSAVASGLLYYAFAYSFYLSALRHVRASIAAASFYLIPVFGLAGSWLVGERLEPGQWVGAALVVASVAAITIRIARPSAVAAPASSDVAAQPSSAAASAQIPITPRPSSRA